MMRAFIATTAAAAAAAIIIGAAALFLLVLIPGQVRAAGCTDMVASHYGSESGIRTANGERFTGRDMTAAHKTLPFGTKLRVTYQGKSVVVRVNDRGPYIKGRTLDISTAAARSIGMTNAGVGMVNVCRQ